MPFRTVSRPEAAVYVSTIARFFGITPTEAEAFTGEDPADDFDPSIERPLDWEARFDFTGTRW